MVWLQLVVKYWSPVAVAGARETLSPVNDPQDQTVAALAEVLL